MPKPGITSRTSSALRLPAFLGLLVLTLAAAFPARAQSPAQPAPPAQPQRATPRQGQRPGYAIEKNVNLVVLHVSVLDNHGDFVSGLQESNFRVFEDKVPQKIAVFRQEDVPVSMGLVIDNSGSMRDKRPEVNAAALALVETSNPQDEEFVVNFNDEFYLDTVHDFTSSLSELKDALERIDSRGSTALYDAVIGSLYHLKKGTRDKKVLLVITDGVDNASRDTLQQAVEEAQRSDAVVYAIGLFGSDMRHGDIKKARRALLGLTKATGGLAYFPKDVSDTKAICTQIAHDIRNQYTVAYYPLNAAQDGSFRAVQVQVTPPPGTGKLSVRTRTGYYARGPAKGD
jgi:Ca-activated chloride channel homolog